MKVSKRVGGSPAIVVAVTALVAALAGTALADAQPDANTAASKVKKALNKAKKANKKAKAAQSSADSAQSSADSAQSSADSAQATANSAQVTADNSLQNPVRRIVGVGLNTNGAGQFRNPTASCPSGEKAIAGGGMWTMPDGSPAEDGILLGARPVPSGNGTGATTGWLATGVSTVGATRTLRAYAICVPL